MPEFTDPIIITATSMWGSIMKVESYIGKFTGDQQVASNGSSVKLHMPTRAKSCCLGAIAQNVFRAPLSTPERLSAVTASMLSARPNERQAPSNNSNTAYRMQGVERAPLRDASISVLARAQDIAVQGKLCVLPTLREALISAACGRQFHVV
ncbi:uncharacterized protein F5891DRAFT_1185247 [Suillus fuscotomentosus]|uniref:Uncharacterized protein n=1 Tax=Suillus fuscotomentosus TaxID=1912939 RepID=A0AAD4EEU3_9AGAM|nr:uncharacterized protein F5891DRAFT_1185247 [Suillus fuscotomentosus]KAG1903618.1 hypothetical protein F5891DRAFT_1185247 [Suillus fuscotomentosus]